jgi:hypothetical protein
MSGLIRRGQLLGARRMIKPTVRTAIVTARIWELGKGNYEIYE